MGGIVPSVLNVIIIATNADPQSTGFYSFVFVTAAEIGSLFLLYFMHRNEFYRHHSDKERNEGRSIEFSSLRFPINIHLQLYFYKKDSLQLQDNLVEQANFVQADATNLRPLPSLGKYNFASYVQVLKDAWVYHVVAFLGFGTTLVVYPAVAVLAEPTSESW